MHTVVVEEARNGKSIGYLQQFVTKAMWVQKDLQLWRTRRSVGALSYYMWTNHLHIQEAWDDTVMMYKHDIIALVIVSAHHPCEAELSTLQKPLPLGVTHAASEMPSTPADE